MGRPKSEDPIKPRTLGLRESVWQEVDDAAEKRGIKPTMWLRAAIASFLMAEREHQRARMEASGQN